MNAKTIFLSIGLLLSLNVYSQNNEDLIRLCIHSYFNGTAYNYIEQIDAAFHPEAELYLENRAGELWKLTGQEYSDLFKKNKPGEFNGRYSKIMSIDIEGNLAMVKAEILYPSINKRFIDVFIVKEVEEGKWQIISKAANSKAIVNE